MSNAGSTTFTGSLSDNGELRQSRPQHPGVDVDPLQMSGVLGVDSQSVRVFHLHADSVLAAVIGLLQLSGPDLAQAGNLSGQFIGSLMEGLPVGVKSLRQRLKE